MYQPIAIAAGRLATLLERPEAEAWLCEAQAIAQRFDAPIWLAEALLARSRLTGERALATEALVAVERLGPTAVGDLARGYLDTV